MNNFSREYTGALVIVIISVLKAFGVELGTEEVTAIVTGAVAVFVAVARYRKGDVTLSGTRK